MLQRGRKSPSANIVALPSPTRSRLIPPAILTVSERKIFVETAAQHPHLLQRDATVLAAFAQASARSSKLVKKDDTKAWEQSVRVMLALARSLRLTPISGVRPESITRKRNSSYSVEKGDSEEEEWGR